MFCVKLENKHHNVNPKEGCLFCYLELYFVLCFFPYKIIFLKLTSFAKQNTLVKISYTVTVLYFFFVINIVTNMYDFIMVNILL